MGENFISKMNTDFVYDKISDILMNEHSINIKLNDKYKKLYEDNITHVYENNIDGTYSLEELNNILLKYSVELLSDKLKGIEQDNKMKTSVNINDLLEQYNKDRSNDINMLKQKKVNNVNGNSNLLNDNSNLLNDNSNLLNDNSNLLNDNSNLLNDNSNLLNDNSLNIKKPNAIFSSTNSKGGKSNIIISSPNPKGVKQKKIIKISSLDRLNNNSSRYNYKIDLKYNNIIFNNNNLDKLILPIEDNYIFSSPIINMKINELNVSLKLDETIENNTRKYGVYYPIDNNIKINFNNNINIHITDISETVHSIIDILNVNKIVINDDYIVLHNKYIITEYLINDYIKLTDFENNIIDMRSVLSYPLKIHDIDGNKLIIKKSNNLKNMDLDIDMKFINLSNQNFIFFK